MITVIAGTGTRCKLREMSTSELQTPPNGADQADIVGKAKALVDGLQSSAEVRAAGAESAEIEAIVAALGLPGELRAAALIYPFVRDELISNKELENNGLESISRIVVDLLQLGRFKLASGWQPGDVLAARQ